MKLLILFLLAGITSAGCFTTQEDRKNLMEGPTDSIEMESPSSLNPGQKSSSDNKHSKLVVIAEGATVFSGPGEKFEVLKVLKKWEELTIIKQKGGWSQIKPDGWVKTKHLGE